MKMTCPSCSAEVEYIENDSEICSECGNELKPAAPADDSKGELFANIDFAAIFGHETAIEEAPAKVTFVNEASAQDRPFGDWDLSERSKAIADHIDSMEFDEPRRSACSHLRIEYNHNLFFMTGSKSVVKLKLTPLDSTLQDLLIFMETERDGAHTRRQIPVREVLQKDKTLFLQTPLVPDETFGRIFLTFYVGCKIKGAFTFYQFSVDHRVYDSKQSGNALCSQITINQDFSSSDAADINYRDSIGDALKKMSDKTLTVNEMIDRLNDLPPKYEVQLLSETTWRPEDVLVKGNLYPAEKLLLEYDGKKIFLLNKRSVKFGRDPEQVDLLVRCGGGTLGPREYPNSTVSRKHAEILYCDDAVKLFDYSSYGTYINDRKPDNSGIPLELNATVEFGDIHWKMNIQRCSARLPHNICQTCSACKIKSVTFTRTDSEPEYYLLIWQCCEMGRIIEDLTDWTIFSRNGFFFIRTPEQDFYHLRPGQTVTSQHKQIKVKYFEQA